MFHSVFAGFDEQFTVLVHSSESHVPPRALHSSSSVGSAVPVSESSSGSGVVSASSSGFSVESASSEPEPESEPLLPDSESEPEPEFTEFQFAFSLSVRSGLSHDNKGMKDKQKQMVK